MNASEAKRIVEAMEDAVGVTLKEHAKQAIEEAVSKGLRQASLPLEFKHHKRMKGWLESLGYEVECGESQRDGCWFYAKW